MNSIMQLIVLKSIFNFEDNYIQGGDDSSIGWDILTNCIGAFVGFGLSILIYSHQIKKEKTKEINSSLQNDKNLLVYYSELIRKFREVTNKNLSLLSEYVKKQESNLTDLQVLPRAPSNDFTRLINVDNKGVFQAWISQFNEADTIKLYQKTNSALDILEGVVKEVQRMHKYVIEHSFSKMKEVKEIVDGIPDRLSIISFELAKELKEDRHTNPYYMFIDANIGIYHKFVNEEADMPKFMNEFVKPLLVGLNKQFPSQLNALEIMMLCKKSRVKYHEVEIDMQNMINEFRKIPDKVSESNNILDNTLGKLSKIV